MLLFFISISPHTYYKQKWNKRIITQWYSTMQVIVIRNAHCFSICDSTIYLKSDVNSFRNPCYRKLIWNVDCDSCLRIGKIGTVLIFSSYQPDLISIVLEVKLILVRADFICRYRLHFVSMTYFFGIGFIVSCWYFEMNDNFDLNLGN